MLNWIYGRKETFRNSNDWIVFLLIGVIRPFQYTYLLKKIISLKCYLMTATGAANWTVNVVHPWLLLTWMVPSILVTSFCTRLAQASPTLFQGSALGTR